jgi:HNH endonuclease
MTSIKCSIPNCDIKVYAKNLCSKHYHRALKYGDPLEPLKNQNRTTAMDEFVDAALSIDTRACVDWPFPLENIGYGHYAKDGSRRAHEYICTRIYGPRPDKQHTRHLCGNQTCINYNHLTWGTAKENAEDKIRHGTQTSGETHHSATLTEVQVIEIRRIYALGETSQKALAELFSVAPSTIEGITMFRTWKQTPGNTLAKSRQYKLTLQQVQEIRYKHSNGIPCKVLSQEFGVTASHIRAIVTYRSWKI